MNCEDFKKWLIDKDLASVKTAEASSEHMGSCEHCAGLFRLDLALEEAVRKNLVAVEPSEGVMTALRIHVRSADNRTVVLRAWRKVFASIVAVAVVALFIAYTLPTSPGGMEELAGLAVEDHLSGDLHMTIQAPNGTVSPSWIGGIIGIAAPPPDLPEVRFAFVGARPCKLGSIRAAYLFYEHEGRIVSVFVIKTRDLRFSPDVGRPYEAKVGGCEVKAWGRGDVLYVMVI